MEARFVLQDHVRIKLIRFHRFRRGKDSFVVLAQNLSAVGRQETLGCPVVLVFLHIETVAARPVMDGFGIFPYLGPGPGRFVGIESRSLEKIRIVVQDRSADGERQTDLLIPDFSQGQDVGEEIFLDKVLILVGILLQIQRRYILEILIKIFQVVVADHGNGR